MTTPAFVVLEDGTIYRGESFGAPVTVPTAKLSSRLL